MIEAQSKHSRSSIAPLLAKGLCALAIMFTKRGKEYDGHWIVSRSDEKILTPRAALADALAQSTNQRLFRFFTRLSALMAKPDPERKVFIAVPTQHYPVD